MPTKSKSVWKPQRSAECTAREALRAHNAAALEQFLAQGGEVLQLSSPSEGALPRPPRQVRERIVRTRDGFTRYEPVNRKV